MNTISNNSNDVDVISDSSSVDIKSKTKHVKMSTTEFTSLFSFKRINDMMNMGYSIYNADDRKKMNEYYAEIDRIESMNIEDEEKNKLRDEQFAKYDKSMDDKIRRITKLTGDVLVYRNMEESELPESVTINGNKYVLKREESSDVEQNKSDTDSCITTTANGYITMPTDEIMRTSTKSGENNNIKNAADNPSDDDDNNNRKVPDNDNNNKVSNSDNKEKITRNFDDFKIF